jgi:hypothetical protein
MSERERLEQAIAHLESQQESLGDAVVEAAVAPSQALDLDAVVAELLAELGE